MKTYMINYTQNSPGQRHALIAMIIPLLAIEYAHVDAGLWYVYTSLSAEEIMEELASEFDENDELRVRELGDEQASLNTRQVWLRGRLPSVASLLAQYGLGPGWYLQPLQRSR